MRAAARRRRAIAPGVAALAALGCCTAPSSAEAAGRVESSFAFTTQVPGQPAGLQAHTVIRNSDDPNGKPPPLRSAVIHGPSGLRFDTTTLRECTASDEELRVRGPDGCPAETRLATGSFIGVTGFGRPLDPVMGDNHVFNGPQQLIEVITRQGTTQVIAIDRLTISGSTLTAHPPRAPGGPPDGEGAVRSIGFRIPVRTAGGKFLITTPPSCPGEGQWTFTVTVGFGDGSTDTSVARLPCALAGQGDQRRLRLAVRPRRVRAGRRVRMRLRGGSTVGSCAAGATVRVGRHRARTDSRGRALMKLRFRHAGTRRLRATSPGCRPASARIRVLPLRRR